MLSSWIPHYQDNKTIPATHTQRAATATSQLWSRHRHQCHRLYKDNDRNNADGQKDSGASWISHRTQKASCSLYYDVFGHTCTSAGTRVRGRLVSKLVNKVLKNKKKCKLYLGDMKTCSGVVLAFLLHVHETFYLYKLHLWHFLSHLRTFGR